MSIDLKLGEWDCDIIGGTELGIPVISEIAELQSAFITNVNRVAQLSEFAQVVYQRGQLHGQATAYARMEILSGRYTPPIDPLDSELWTAREVEQLAQDYLARRVNCPQQLIALAFANDPLDSSKRYDDFHTLMTTQIIGAWTAVETLLGDLGETAINLHPNDLSQLKGKPTGNKRNDSQSDNKKEQGQKTMKLSELQTHGFDLAYKMGTILRGRFKFTILENARDAYSQAFWKDGDAILSAVSERSLESLSVLRNVLVHKNGIADEEYETRAKNLPLIPHLKKGDGVRLDGTIVSQLFWPCCEHCLALIMEVDKWITTH